MTTNVEVKSKICIIGGGFGGLYTALKLSELTNGSDDIEITLIDPKDKFVFLPLLYELAMGAASVVEVSPRYETLLKGSKVKFIQSAVSEINLRKNEIKLFDSGSDPIKYDQVVISVGAQPRLDLVNGEVMLHWHHRHRAAYRNEYYVCNQHFMVFNSILFY